MAAPSWCATIIASIYEYISDADLSLAWPAISRSFAVTGSVRYRGEPMEIGVTLSNFAAALQGERSDIESAGRRSSVQVHLRRRDSDAIQH